MILASLTINFSSPLNEVIGFRSPAWFHLFCGWDVGVDMWSVTVLLSTESEWSPTFNIYHFGEWEEIINVWFWSLGTGLCFSWYSGDSIGERPIEIHLGCFHIFAIKNKAAVNIQCRFFCGHVSSTHWINTRWHNC